MPQGKVIGLVVALVAIGGLIAYFEGAKPARISSGVDGGGTLALPLDVASSSFEASCTSTICTSTRETTSTGGSAVASFRPKPSGNHPVVKEIASPSGFINTQPFKLAEIVGKKVILVDFWTYSCINCQRTTPYLNAWYAKYKDQGLEIVGIHTPEFEFEKNYENVSRAVREAGIKYPVVLDNDYATWSAYGNRFWPRKYLVDINGNIVFDHIGEGAYAETERKIQELLQERKVALSERGNIVGGIAAPSDVTTVDDTKPRSVEIYFGSARNKFLVNGKPFVKGVQTLSAPATTKTGELYLAGEWEFTDEYAENKSAGAKIIFRYVGKNVYFVANSTNDASVTLRRDGVPLEASAGADVIDSKVRIREERLYTLVEDTAYGEYTLEIMIENPGLRAFTFTFG